MPVPVPYKGTGSIGTVIGRWQMTSLLDVLDALAESGVTFDLDRSMPRPVVVFDPPLLPDAAELLEPWMVWLAYVALGRYTRHAPVVCDRCGFVSMTRVVHERAGTWRTAGTCALCAGHRSVVGEPDLRRLTRRRAAAPRVGS